MRSAGQAVVQARLDGDGSGDLDPSRAARRVAAGGLGVKAERGRGREARREECREPDAAGEANSLHPPDHPIGKRAGR